MRISVDVKGIDAVKARIAGLGRQVEYAASRALNATGKKVADAMPAELEKDLDRPTPFTKRGVAVLRYANKTRLETVVGFRAAQAKYMLLNIAGGVRTPGAAGLKLPSTIKVNEFGNIPRGAIARLVAIARKEGKSRSTKVAGQRIRVSADVELFYGDPQDGKGRNLPRGIYKIVGRGVGAKIIPLIVFPVVPARYKPRFDFERKAAAVIAREWPREFDAALAEALRTAR